MVTDHEHPENGGDSVSQDDPEQPRGVSTRRRFPIVGIGASAGGLDALRSLFQAMPADTGMSFVVTQHLDAAHQSLLADLLSKFTSLAVMQVENGMGVEPNRVYVIPPNSYMTVSDGILLLKPPSDPRGMRMPIDRFLFSLAEDQQDRAIGIILSGSGTDGTLGVREVKAGGGMVLIQDPETAQYDGMPRSAIATGQADAVLPLERMPEVLLSYARHAYVGDQSPVLPSLDAGYDPLTAILSLLLAKTGHDFRCYKKGTLVRRIHRRMGITGTERFEAYLDLMRERDGEVRALSKDLFIGVTSFFRETEAWSAIAKQVIAPIVAGHAGDAPVRVWVPGCASGEEAYTLAILFTEAFERDTKNVHLLIFATDVDTDALQVGRAALYQKNIAESLSPERLERFFTKEGNCYLVKKSLRDLVVFTPQNLIADSPFSKLDLVSCRNLLIYLESRLQEKILRLFHFALKPDGFLVLGSSESLGSQQREFRTLSKKWRIFTPEGPSQLGLMEMPMSRDAERSVPRFLARGLGRREPSLADMAQQALVETFAPASVLVTRRSQVLFVYGDILDYLTHPPGELTDDLISMTRIELRLKTRAALHQATGENRQVVMHGGRVKRGKTELPGAITVTPLQQPPLVAGLLLVSFQRAPEEARQVPALDLGQGPEAEIVRQMEDELKTTREELQSTIEELETSNEELKASNEEVMSMNEELQSSNEELETSQEELQSLNEELTTVNNQLQNKVVEIEATNNDLSNLLSSTNIATLFLDRDLRIRRFTPATTRLMNLIPVDVGRPVADIAHKYVDNELPADCHDVLAELQPVERELRGGDGEWYIRRVQPYRTQDNHIEGTVVTFTDVTAMKRRDEEQARLASIVESSSEAIVSNTLGGVISSWNPAAEALYGYRTEEVVGQSVAILFSDTRQEECTHILAEIQAGRRVGPYETECRRKDGERIQVSITASPIRDAGGAPLGASIIGSDITERKRAEQLLLNADQRKNQFLAVLGHELRNPLAPIRNAVQVLTLQDSLPETVRWAVDLIGRQSAQLEQLVNDLLDVARISGGRVQLRMSTVTVQDALEDAVQTVASMAELYRQHLETRLPETPVLVTADPVRLAQIFTNLLHNAVKYTPDGGHIRVSVRLEGRDAVVRVRDDGEGIRPEDLPRLFDFFSQGDTEHQHIRSSDGLGVGLALAAQLVQRHGGTLKASSAGPGQGSEFVVTLPTCTEVVTPSTQGESEADDEVRFRERRILVVDDNPDVANSFQVLLETMGYHVRALNAGREVLAAIREFRPQVVFLDIAMPDISGYQVAAAIRAADLDYRPFLVALTGYGQDSDRKSALEAGFDYHLLKPQDPKEIATLLEGLD